MNYFQNSTQEKVALYAAKKSLDVAAEGDRQKIVTDENFKRLTDAALVEIYKREISPTVYRAENGIIYLSHVLDGKKISTTKFLDVDALRMNRYFTKKQELFNLSWKIGNVEKILWVKKTPDFEERLLSILIAEGLRVLCVVHPDIKRAFFSFVVRESTSVEIPERWGWNKMMDGRFVFCRDRNNMEDLSHEE